HLPRNVGRKFSCSSLEIIESFPRLCAKIDTGHDDRRNELSILENAGTPADAASLSRQQQIRKSICCSARSIPILSISSVRILQICPGSLRSQFAHFNLMLRKSQSSGANRSKSVLRLAF